MKINIRDLACPKGSILAGFAEWPASTTRKEWFAITRQLIQQPLALKGLQCPQCFAVLVLEAVAVLNHVLAGRALELPPPFATQLQNVSHGVGELVLLLLFEQGFQLLRGVTLQGPAAEVLKDQQLKVLLTAFGLKQHPLVRLGLFPLEPRQVDDLAERGGQCCAAS